jgi:hypothetical protein
LLCLLQIARYKRQRAAEAKLEEIKERKERRSRSTKAAAVSTPVEAGEEDVLDDDGEEEREVSCYPCAYRISCGDDLKYFRTLLIIFSMMKIVVGV